MCLALISIESHPLYRLILIGNRDEYYNRPTAPAAFWSEFPELLAGKDLLAGGTWFGITKKGRIALITNYRNPALFRSNAPSRGRLALDALLSSQKPMDHLNGIAQTAGKYNGFNLFVGENNEFCWHSNMAGSPRLLTSGIYGLSNHLLDTPWPKVKQSKKALRKLLEEKDHPLSEDFFSILLDRSIPDDRELPDTGVSLEKERLLSSVFISSADYGTRCSSVLLVDFHNQVTFWERTYKNGQDSPSTVKFQFRFSP